MPRDKLSEGCLDEEQVARPRGEPGADDSIPSGKWAVLSRLVARIVATKGPIEPFGANDITREIESRWGDRLKRRVDPRTVAAKLRRMARTGRIHQLRAGRAFTSRCTAEPRRPPESSPGRRGP